MVQGCLDLRLSLSSPWCSGRLLLLACVEVLEMNEALIDICVFGFYLEKWFLEML